MRLSLLSAACAAMFATAAGAATVVTQTGPNSVRADFSLTDAAGKTYAGAFFLEFTSPIGLTPANLNVQARLVDPADPALQARLPIGGSVGVPAAFPVLVSVDPLLGSGFGFRDVASVEMYTKALPFSTGSQFRLVRSPKNGAFAEVTTDIQPGSIRMRARTGHFSDFLVVRDERSSAAVATDLYARLSAKLQDDDVPAGTASLLGVEIDHSFEEFLEGDYEDAREELDAFELIVGAESGVSLPNQWRAQRDLDNVAGTLAADALALDFLLQRLAAEGSGSGDDDGDDGDDD